MPFFYLRSACLVSALNRYKQLNLLIILYIQDSLLYCIINPLHLTMPLYNEMAAIICTVPAAESIP